MTKSNKNWMKVKLIQVHLIAASQIFFIWGFIKWQPVLSYCKCIQFLSTIFFIQMRCFLLNIWLSVNFVWVVCLNLFRLRIRFAIISGVILVYDGFTVKEAALINENNKVIEEIIFIFLAYSRKFSCKEEPTAPYKG